MHGPRLLLGLRSSSSNQRIRSREIFGEQLPCVKLLRAGASEATTFVTTADVIEGGRDVPAGSYTIFPIPSTNKWTLIISKTKGEWGTKYSGEANELARVDTKTCFGTRHAVQAQRAPSRTNCLTSWWAAGD